MITFYLDVDGVLLDYEGGLRLMLAELYPDVFSETRTVQEMMNCFTEADHRYKVIRQFMNTEYFSQLPSIINIADYNELRGYGKIYLVTNIPYTAVKFRRDNLSRLGMIYEEIHSGGFENYGMRDYPLKSEVINKLHPRGEIGYFLDDMVENCEDISFNVTNVTPVHLNPDVKDESLFVQVENFSRFVGLVRKELG